MSETVLITGAGIGIGRASAKAFAAAATMSSSRIFWRPRGNPAWPRSWRRAEALSSTRSMCGRPKRPMHWLPRSRQNGAGLM